MKRYLANIFVSLALISGVGGAYVVVNFELPNNFFWFLQWSDSDGEQGTHKDRPW